MADDVVGVALALRWRIPIGQRFVFEDFEDGIVMFDALVGSTHVVSVTAAETLALIVQTSGLTAMEIHERLLKRIGVSPDALPFAAMLELLWQLEHLDLVTAENP